LKNVCRKENYRKKEEKKDDNKVTFSNFPEMMGLDKSKKEEKMTSPKDRRELSPSDRPPDSPLEDSTLNNSQDYRNQSSPEHVRKLEKTEKRTNLPKKRTRYPFAGEKKARASAPSVPKRLSEKRKENDV